MMIRSREDSSYDTRISGFDFLFHLYSDLPVVLNHADLVFLPVEVLPPGLWRTVLQENAAVLAVKLLAHLLSL